MASDARCATRDSIDASIRAKLAYWVPMFEVHKMKRVTSSDIPAAVIVVRSATGVGQKVVRP
jgi:hypothetical protein